MNSYWYYLVILVGAYFCFVAGLNVYAFSVAVVLEDLVFSSWFTAGYLFAVAIKFTVGGVLILGSYDELRVVFE